MAAAYTGMIPLQFAALAAMQPGFDPEAEREELRRLMEERPGAGESTMTFAHLRDSTAAESGHGSGFAVKRRSSPSERCRWLGCHVPLYAREKPRKAGKPRKYCPGHQKAARARTERLRYRGIHVGRHRNMSYRDTCPIATPADDAAWKKRARTPLGGRCTDQFQQNREVWEGANLPQR
ncbi:hypothetical protein RB200_17920 [Streptomyces sp. PmtG]